MLGRIVTLLLTFFGTFSLIADGKKQIDFLTSVPTYNHEFWCKNNLMSASPQACPQCHIYKVGDYSRNKSNTDEVTLEEEEETNNNAIVKEEKPEAKPEAKPTKQNIVSDTKKMIEFAVVIPSYNNEKWCEKNLNSVLHQSYPYWHIYYVNDYSGDKTGDIVDAFIREKNIEHKCTIIHNTERRGKLANFYEVIRKLPPEVVVVEIDGDDWLANPQVLETLAAIYRNKDIWLTYGDFIHYPGYRKSFAAKFPPKVIQNNSFRYYQRYITHHLRTFYARLFQRIKEDDLLIKGIFYPMAGDLAYMFPMLEMASKGHFRMLKQVMYVYNVANPINDYKVNRTFQVRLDRYIRSLPRYRPLQSLFPIKYAPSNSSNGKNYIKTKERYELSPSPKKIKKILKKHHVVYW